MKISLKYNRRNNIFFWVILIIATVLFFEAHYKWWVLAGFLVLYYLIRSLEIELNDKLPWVWMLMMFAGGATLTMYSIQYLLLDAEDFAKTTGEKLFYNFLIVLAVYFIVQTFAKKPAISCIISHVLLLGFGFVDYFVYAFRGNEITIADLQSAKTGLSVAGKYNFYLNDKACYVILASILFISFMRKLSVKFEKPWQMRILTVLSSVACVVIVSVNSVGVITETWEMKGTYRNGFLLNFALGVRDSFVGAPEGYCNEVIEELEKEYCRISDEKNQIGSSSGSIETVEAIPSTEEGYLNTEISEVADNSADNNADNNDVDMQSSVGSESIESANTSEDAGISVSGEKKPTIIAIMSESYADLTVIGDFDTNATVTPFYDSLYENTTKGYALASVYGAKTPNSEWEYLTGHSMAFLPEGSVVDQQYIDDKPASLVSTLANKGYTCVAMHPYYETGWSRNSIYPTMGFDEMHFIDDFDQSNILREYITDQELFDGIIERYESKADDENLFIFGVTMQNHGGYGDSYENFDEKIYKIGYSYTDANQYLSLLRESDKALQNLITYFNSVDEPVEIVFFGDHQPGLNSKFIKLLNGKGLSGLSENELEDLYTVPFFIWTNYDTPEETVDITSLNYLSTMTLERANISLPPYNQFLAELQQEIPAINARGYYSKAAGEYIHIEDASQDEAQWIEKYKILQYNAMFDDDNRSEIFFPYPSE